MAELHKRFRFVFVDCQDIRTWGGNDYDWTNATHINRSNMRRLLRWCDPLRSVRPVWPLFAGLAV